MIKLHQICIYVAIIVTNCLLCNNLNSQQKLSNIDYVDVFIGTANDQGQTDPSASVPFGMIKVGPDCIPSSHVGYDFEKTKISGFSINRLNGTGCNGTGGNLSIRPASPKVTLNIVKETEVGKPGYYSTLLDNGVKVELTANNNVAIENFTFDTKNKDRNFYIDLTKSFTPLDGFEYNVISENEIVGWISAQNTCNVGRYKFYFYINVNENFRLIGREDNSIAISFNQSIPFVEFRVSISPVSIDDAKKRFKEIENNSFEDIKHLSQKLWEEKLNTIDVKGKKDDMKMFYSSLYRCFLTPVNSMAIDGSFSNSQGEIEMANGFEYYSTWSLWDTYRTKFPLFTLIDSKRMEDFCKSLSKLYQSGKAAWSTMYECAPTVRTEHSSIILLDAYNKGIRGCDFAPIYNELVAEAEAIELISPDNYLEAAYDYWALAQIAKLLDKQSDYKKYSEKATYTWQKIWVEKFKTIDNKTFDIMHGDGLYEGTLWQYRWAVPFDIDELVKLAGGKKIFKEQLRYFFENNLYNHGNQPDIHAAYLFNRIGEPQQTQYWVTNILTKPMPHCYGTHDKFKEPYVDKAYKPIPRAYIPEMDDDDGTMAAWYVLSAMGIYPLTVGSDIYELSSPIFDQIDLKFANGKTFTIIADRKSDKNYPIKSITHNGKKINDYQIKHRELVNGGQILIKFE